jgi:hypothetical protein
MNWKNYKPQNVQAVDMCAATIYTHREKLIPIKAIHLLPRMFEQFKRWTEKQLGRELNEGEGLQFDDVNIELGTASQSTPLLIELWNSQKELEVFLNSKFLNKQKILA